MGLKGIGIQAMIDSMIASRTYICSIAIQTPEGLDEGVKQWEEVLNKMIWAFQQIAYEDYDEKYHHGKADFDFVKTDRKFPNPVTGIMEDTFQMVDKNPGGHWYDYVGHQLHEERIQEGLELFGKYYRALWD